MTEKGFVMTIKPDQAMLHKLDRRQTLAGLAMSTGLLAAGPALATKKPDDTETYTSDEIITQASDFLGVTAEALGGALEKIFGDFGDKPTAYLAGQEASGAVGVGLRYGKGNLFMKSEAEPSRVFWQGPSIGFDGGGNASRVFTLAYKLEEPKDIFRRFPGVEGSAYYLGGLGVNYQRAEGIVLTPIRAGVGFRLGANMGYLVYSKKRHILPL